MIATNRIARRGPNQRATGALALLAFVALTFSAVRNTMANGEAQFDRRAAEVRHLNMRTTFQAPATKAAWEARKKELREQILVASGLWPMPEKTPLHARVFGKVEGDDYTIEKVLLETWPGFFLAGNLYRPKGKKGPFPAILNPHGHWAHGRLENTDVCSIPGRCTSFARQGFIAFAYDMIGRTDTTQMAHAYKGDELWGWGALGMQLWDSIRAADFLQSLPDVDPKRLGCTGASGGGTQTFILTAVDDRIQVAAPVNMISGTMQGGCQCENAPLLRLDTNNIEIGAMMAPRPLLLISATGDWTRETPTVEYPAIRAVYALYGAEDRVKSVQIDAGHNYNRASRAPVYVWFGRWLNRDTDEAHYQERPFDVDPAALRVGSSDGTPGQADNLPRRAEISNDEFLLSWKGASERQLETLKPADSAGLRRFRSAMEPALRHSLAAEWPAPENVTAAPDGAPSAARGATAERLWLGRKGRGDRVPALLLTKPGGQKGPGTLVVHPGGIDALVDPDSGEPKPIVGQLLGQGRAVLVIDPFLIGRSKAPESRAAEIAKIGFFTAYNRTDLANRVQDILTALAYLQGRPEVSRVRLVGLGDSGLWCLLARALARDVEATVVDAARLNAQDDEQLREHLFTPGLRRAGDLRTAGTLIAPARLFVHNAAPGFPSDWLTTTYRAAGAPDHLRLQDTAAGDEEIIWWLGRAK